MELGEYFCNGVPLSTSANGTVTYSAPLTTQQVLTSASAHLDTALTFLTETDTAAVSLLNAARVTKARAGDNIIWQGEYIEPTWCSRSRREKRTTHS